MANIAAWRSGPSWLTSGTPTDEQIPLVNIVRSRAQAELLRSAGAAYVCDSTSDTFIDDLIEALRATSATLAFDAVGGGVLASRILTCMEAAIGAGAEYSRYGSSVHKQVYIYGGLDRGPTELTRSFGMAWGVGGWLVTPFLQKVGAVKVAAMRLRVAAGLTTTFASSFAGKVTLAGALQLELDGGALSGRFPPPSVVVLTDDRLAVAGPTGSPVIRGAAELAWLVAGARVTQRTARLADRLVEAG